MKPIRYTDEYIEQAVAEYAAKFRDTLIGETVACHDKHCQDMPLEDKIEVHFDLDAWRKCTALVQCCDKEIAWYALTSRSEDGTMIYVSDILVPPQNVTGTSVDCDPTEFCEWCLSLTDEQVASMRCHMHSHVNMGVFSSGVDDDYQKDMILKDVRDYMLFLILNKKGEVFARYYDVENNIMYDNDDIKVCTPYLQTEWALDQIKDKVKTKAPVRYSTKPVSTMNFGNSYTYGY